MADLETIFTSTDINTETNTNFYLEVRVLRGILVKTFYFFKIFAANS